MIVAQQPEACFRGENGKKIEAISLDLSKIDFGHAMFSPLF